MIFTKMLVIPIAVLIAVAGFLTTDPTISSFFEGIKEKFYSIAQKEPPVARNIDFSLSINNYPEIEFDRAVAMNISTKGHVNATLQNGNILASSMEILDYRGTGFVSGMLVLNGTFGTLKTESIIMTSDRLYSESNFSEVRIENLRINNINLTGTGYLNLTNSSISFSGQIEIKEPRGVFTFSKDPLQMVIEGHAQKITMQGIEIDLK